MVDSELSLWTGEGLWLLRSPLSLSSSDSHNKLWCSPEIKENSFPFSLAYEQRGKGRERQQPLLVIKRQGEASWKCKLGSIWAHSSPLTSLASLSWPASYTLLLPPHTVLQWRQRPRSFKLSYVYVHLVSFTWNALSIFPPLTLNSQENKLTFKH